MFYFSIILIITASFVWGYLSGKLTGMKDGYNFCLKECLVANIEHRNKLNPDKRPVKKVDLDSCTVEETIDWLYDKTK